MKIKVTPFHRSGYEAPCFVVNIEEKEKNPMSKAIDIVKPMSRLSDFPNSWIFYPELI